MRPKPDDPSGDAHAALDRDTIAQLRSDIVRFLTRRAGHRVLAEDLAQESMLHALRGLPKFRSRAALRICVRRIAARYGPR